MQGTAILLGLAGPMAAPGVVAPAPVAASTSETASASSVHPAPTGISPPPSLDTLDPAGVLGREMLIPNGITWNDLDLQSGSGRPIPFRLAEVETLLHAPEALPNDVARLRLRWSPGLNGPLPLDSLVLAMIPIPDSLAPDSFFSARALPETSSGCAGIATCLRRYAAGLKAEEWAFLRKTASTLFVMHPDDTLLDAVSQERERLMAQRASDSAFGLARRLKSQPLLAAARTLQALQMRMADTLRALTSSAQGPGSGARVRSVLRALAKSTGLVYHEGRLAGETHQVDEGIWFDPGGDDTWELRGSGRPGRALFIFDAAGDDHYVARDTLPVLPGFGGVQLLFDAAGNDSYEDRGFATAAGVFGISTLFDAAGDDVYEGGTATQGFGFFGLGLLQDMGGRDGYAATLFAQGAASTRGLGLLLDAGGNDGYTLRPAFVDDLRYRDHFLSMGQGFATGFMLGEAGGIGMLWDASGHDTYVADIFAQGSGYWHGLGLLLDEAGSDRYLAHQYAQGSGVHEAVGLLWDAEGQDKYVSKGVSQGCGHDRGLGWLHDVSGDDVYAADDMSQGGGSANGLGILFDARGDDVYHAVKSDKTLGHGDMRRDRGSYGFFFDGEGRDLYPERPRQGSAWRVFGREGRGNGYGLDR